MRYVTYILQLVLQSVSICRHFFLVAVPIHRSAVSGSSAQLPTFFVWVYWRMILPFLGFLDLSIFRIVPCLHEVCYHETVTIMHWLNVQENATPAQHSFASASNNIETKANNGKVNEGFGGKQNAAVTLEDPLRFREKLRPQSVPRKRKHHRETIESGVSFFSGVTQLAY